MDARKLLIYLFVLNIIVDGINCDPQCDCTSLVEENRFIKLKLSKIEFDNFKIESRLKRLEASKGHFTWTNSETASKESDRQLTHDYKKEDTHDNDRIASVEAKLVGIESLLKIGDINGTDVQQKTLQSEVLDKMETNLSSVSIILDRIDNKLSSVSQQVYNTIAKNDANKAVLGNVVRKTLRAEKRNRIKFEVAIKEAVEEIKSSFVEFKEESDNMMHNQSDTFDRKLGQSTMIINGSLNYLTEELSDTKTGLSSLREATIDNKIDGGWSVWETWGSCSETCGGGVQSRVRTCSNPRPSSTGKFCDGSPFLMRTCNKHRCKEFNVAFTSYHIPSTFSYSSSLVFTLTHINNGNAYDTTTGKFTCKIPGVYYFSVTLTKMYIKISSIYAYLRINNENKLQIHWKLYNDGKNEYDATTLTQSGTFYLNKNDVVDIYGIPQCFSGHIASTFTGYLITPD